MGGRDSHGPARFRLADILKGMANGPCPAAVCGADVPPLVGSVLTGTGLTLAQAAAAIEHGDTPPLTDVQRRIVERFVADRAA